jgi:hypothetical protein
LVVLEGEFETRLTRIFSLVSARWGEGSQKKSQKLRAEGSDSQFLNRLLEEFGRGMSAEAQKPDAVAGQTVSPGHTHIRLRSEGCPQYIRTTDSLQGVQGYRTD